MWQGDLFQFPSDTWTLCSVAAVPLAAGSPSPGSGALGPITPALSGTSGQLRQGAPLERGTGGSVPVGRDETGSSVCLARHCGSDRLGGENLKASPHLGLQPCPSCLMETSSSKANCSLMFGGAW